MEDELMNWPLEATTLETLQPLSLNILDDQESSINLNKLSRSEIAGKLLEHLDQISEGQETEPFDWFSTEKTIDIPIFENISSPIQNGFQNIKSIPASHYTYFDSPEYEPTFAPTNYVYEASTVPEVPQQQSMYSSSLSAAVAMPNVVSNAAVPPSVSGVDVDPKKEVLTPPDSPKDEEILKLLEEIEPGDWEKLVFGDRPNEANSSAVSENSFSLDEVSDYAASSPCLAGSECSSDDADYVPRNIRKMNSSNAGSTFKQRRPSKMYSRHSVEERKLRKKEQNKNAATRYRMKKKQEVEECKIEEKRLADKNKDLRNKLDDISREIKCLKSLMRDVYRKKGLIN